MVSPTGLRIVVKTVFRVNDLLSHIINVNTYKKENVLEWNSQPRMAIKTGKMVWEGEGEQTKIAGVAGI
jgi:hypothetical protein